MTTESSTESATTRPPRINIEHVFEFTPEWTLKQEACGHKSLEYQGNISVSRRPQGRSSSGSAEDLAGDPGDLLRGFIRRRGRPHDVAEHEPHHRIGGVVELDIGQSEIGMAFVNHSDNS